MMVGAKASGEKTADAAICAGPGFLYGILFVSDATNAITVDVYDNASAASGSKLTPQLVITSSATDRIQGIWFDHPVEFFDGLYVDITCAGAAKYVAYFREG